MFRLSFSFSIDFIEHLFILHLKQFFQQGWLMLLKFWGVIQLIKPNSNFKITVAFLALWAKYLYWNKQS